MYNVYVCICTCLTLISKKYIFFRSFQIHYPFIQKLLKAFGVPKGPQESMGKSFFPPYFFHRKCCVGQRNAPSFSNKALFCGTGNHQFYIVYKYIYSAPPKKNGPNFWCLDVPKRAPPDYLKLAELHNE